jgi:hypothetical protein
MHRTDVYCVNNAMIVRFSHLVDLTAWILRHGQRTSLGSSELAINR